MKNAALYSRSKIDFKKKLDVTSLSQQTSFSPILLPSRYNLALFSHWLFPLLSKSPRFSHHLCMLQLREVPAEEILKHFHWSAQEDTALPHPLKDKALTGVFPSLGKYHCIRPKWSRFFQNSHCNGERCAISFLKNIRRKQEVVRKTRMGKKGVG